MMNRDLSIVRLISLGVVVGLSSVGCKSNPFPEDDRTKSNAPLAPLRNVDNFTVIEPDQFQVAEGRTEESTLTVRSQISGNLVIALTPGQDLPPWVVFNAATKKLTLRPDFSAANDSVNPMTAVRDYTVMFDISSPASREILVRRSISIRVQDTPRDFTVTPSTLTPQVSEGRTLSVNLQITNLDFPQGPFQFIAENFPPGCLVVPVAGNPNLFRVEYTPNFMTIRRTDTDFPTRRHNSRVRFADPRGHLFELQLPIEVRDARQRVVISAPTSIRGQQALAVQVRVDDPNGETEPGLTVNNVPAFGNFGTPIRVEGNNGQNGQPAFAIYSVLWTDVPAARWGSQYSVQLNGCNFAGAGGGLTACVQAPLTFNLEGTPANPPIIERTSWPATETRYIRVGETTMAPIRIRDANFPDRAVTTVTTTPRGTGVTVRIEDNSRLVVQGVAAGTAIVQVTSTSQLGLSATETFLVRVLPAAWAKTAVIGENSNVQETQKYVSWISSSAAVNEPVDSPLFEEMFALRTGGVMSTSGLLSRVSSALFDAVRPRLTRTLVASPRLDLLPASFRTELEGMGLVFGPRVAIGTEIVNAIVPAAGSGLVVPPGVLTTLRGTLGSESSRVATFSVRAGTNRCISMFESPRVAPATGRAILGVRCTRTNGTIVYIVGFEFPDVNFDGEAQPDFTVRNWMNQFFP